MQANNVTSIPDPALLAAVRAPAQRAAVHTEPRPRAETDKAEGGTAFVDEEPELSQLTQAVDQLQTTADFANRRLQFKIDDAVERVQVLVINRDTDEVIREIPPSAVLRLAERIQGMLGALIDTAA